MREATRKGSTRRRAAVAVTSLALAASGAAWAGCGDDNSNKANEAVDKALKQSETVQEQVQEQVNKAQKQAEKLQNKANKQVQQAQEQAKKAQQQAQDYNK